MLELNPYLFSVDASTKGGGRFIEDPAQVENIVFQTRGAALTAFEGHFAEALMIAYGEGAEELEDVVTALNVQRFADRAGAAWTEETLTAELAALSVLFVPTGAAR